MDDNWGVPPDQYMSRSYFPLIFPIRDEIAPPPGRRRRFFCRGVLGLLGTPGQDEKGHEKHVVSWYIIVVHHSGIIVVYNIDIHRAIEKSYMIYTYITDIIVYR
jgi:hypothetical protein